MLENSENFVASIVYNLLLCSDSSLIFLVPEDDDLLSGWRSVSGANVTAKISDATSRLYVELRARLIQVNDGIVGDITTKINLVRKECREQDLEEFFPDRLRKLYEDELPGYAKQLFTEAGKFFRQEGRAFNDQDEDALRVVVRETIAPWLDLQITWLQLDPYISRLYQEHPATASAVDNTNKMATLLDAMLTSQISEFRKTFAKDRSTSTKFPSPPNLKWHEIEMKVGEKSVRIIARDVPPRTVTFDDMGFDDGRKTLEGPSPNVQWALLGILAEYGEIRWSPGRHAVSRKNKKKQHRKHGDDDARAYESGSDGFSEDWKPGRLEASMKKKKRELIKTLQTYFGLIDDPFFPYRERKAWVPRFKISKVDPSR